MPSIVRSYAIATGLAVATFLIYARTLQPGIVGGDAGEFQFVPPRLGIPHYTGYPLYVLVGKLWSVLPIGSVAYRMNMLSAVMAAGAIGFTFLASRELGLRLLPACLGATASGTTWLLWQWATIAGVRAAAVLFAALVLWAAIRFSKSLEYGPDDVSNRDFIVLAFVLGLSLAHHRSTLFWFPALLLVMLAARRKPWSDGRVAAIAAAALTAPLLLYLYLPLRAAIGAPYDQFHPNTWQRFWELVGAVNVSRGLAGLPMSAMPTRLGLLRSEIVREYGVPLAVSAFFGALVLLVRRPALALLCLVFTVEIAGQVLEWNIGPTRLNVVYLMPAFVVVSTCIASGADAVISLLERPLPHAFQWLPGVLVVGVGLVVLYPVAMANKTERSLRSNTPPDSYRQDLEWGIWPQRLVNSSLPYVDPDALIFTDWEQSVLFNYARLIDDIRPDVEINWASGDVASADIQGALRTGRPVYVIRPTDSLKGLHLSALGPLIRVSREPVRQLPESAQPLHVRLEDGMGLAGYSIVDDRGTPSVAHVHVRRVLTLVLFWNTTRTPEKNYSTSIRLLKPDGASARQLDNANPVYALYPTSAWSPGEIVGDAYEFDVREYPEGTYAIIAIMYEHSGNSFRNLRQLDANDKPGSEVIQISRVAIG